MANREGRKTVAAELPVELYEKLMWCVGKKNPATDQPMKRMSDVLRFLLEDSFSQVFNNDWVAEQPRSRAGCASKRTWSTPWDRHPPAT